MCKRNTTEIFCKEIKRKFLHRNEQWVTGEYSTQCFTPFGSLLVRGLWMCCDATCKGSFSTHCSEFSRRSKCVEHRESIARCVSESAQCLCTLKIMVSRNMHTEADNRWSCLIRHHREFPYPPRFPLSIAYLTDERALGKERARR